MQGKSIGIEKRIPLSVLELALRAVLDGTTSPTYFQEIATAECSGANRIKKVVFALNRFLKRSELIPYIEAHKAEIKTMLRSGYDRPLLFVAIMCSGYSFFYDTVAILGKFFHAQEQISRVYMLKKLSEIYGSNRMLDVAYDCVMPMLVDAGFIQRARPGIYEIVRHNKYSDVAKDIYIKSFLINNPYYKETDDILTKSYFEFIRKVL